MTNLEIARLFHEAYERLAPTFGYETRPETRAFDPESPNGKLMVAVVSEVMDRYDAARTIEPTAPPPILILDRDAYRTFRFNVPVDHIVINPTGTDPAGLESPEEVRDHAVWGFANNQEIFATLENKGLPVGVALPENRQNEPPAKPFRCCNWCSTPDECKRQGDCGQGFMSGGAPNRNGD